MNGGTKQYMRDGRAGGTRRGNATMTAMFEGPPMGPAPEGYNPVIKARLEAAKSPGSLVLLSRLPESRTGFYTEVASGTSPTTAAFWAFAIDGGAANTLVSLQTRGLVNAKMLRSQSDQLTVGCQCAGPADYDTSKSAYFAPINPTGAFNGNTIQAVGTVVSFSEIEGDPTHTIARIYVHPAPKD